MSDTTHVGPPPAQPTAQVAQPEQPAVPSWILILGGRKQTAALLGTLATAVTGAMFTLLQIKGFPVPESLTHWIVAAIASKFVAQILGQAYVDGAAGSTSSAYAPKTLSDAEKELAK